MDKQRLQFGKWDIIVIAGVLVLAVLVFCLFLPGQETAAYAEIYLDGELVKTVSLSENQEFTVTGRYVNVITINDGKIAVTESDCPGEDCVHCGWSGDAHKSIVCLPNGLEIRIVSAPSDVDIVVG